VTSPLEQDQDFTGDPVAAAKLRSVREAEEDQRAVEELADDDFWDQRRSLRHVHDFSRARMTSPWAVLGVVLTRVMVTTPPFVVLPPLVGSYGSLNFFVALVGPSGSGKGAAEATAADAVDFNGAEVYVAPMGSGEGVAHQYRRREKAAVVEIRNAVMFTMPEVDTLTALGARQGSTLLPVLRSAWSGEKIGFSNADAARTLPLPAHSYRLGLSLGVQPGRAGTLLGDSDGGTPQRFLWLPTLDSHAPDEPPPEPPPMQLERRRPWMANAGGKCVLDVPDIAATTIRRARLARLRGEGEALDGHALLTRLKTAQALTFLDDRDHMTDEDWHLAGAVMRVSDRTRTAVKRELIKTSVEANVARGRADGLRAAIAEETSHTRDVQRVCRWLSRYLDRQGETPAGAVRKAMPSRDRKHYEEAVDRLRDAGQLRETTTDHGTRLAPAEGARP
jgi:hypothetical protein